MTAQQVNIAVPVELAAEIRARVASGEFASENEVIGEGLRALSQRDATIERWLRDEVVPEIAYDDAHPEERLTIDEVRARFAAKFAGRV